MNFLFLILAIGFLGDMMATVRTEKENKGRIAIDILIALMALVLVVKSIVE